MGLGWGGLVLGAALAAGAASVGDGGFTETFGKDLPADWQVADYDFSHPLFATDWRKAQVLTGEGGSGVGLRLSPRADAAGRFLGASVRTGRPAHFGSFAARMRAARGDGIVTGFFTYTGPHYGTRHDEIDVEILGKDPTKLHMSWFVDGNRETRVVPLGFDASATCAVYGFDWREDALSWTVNGRVVFQTQRADGPIPQVPGFVFANLWAAAPPLADWAGRPHHGLEASAQFDWIAHRPGPGPLLLDPGMVQGGGCEQG